MAAATPEGWEIEIFDENTGTMDYDRVHADLVGLVILVANLMQKRSYHREFNRNMRELRKPNQGP